MIGITRMRRRQGLATAAVVAIASAGVAILGISLRDDAPNRAVEHCGAPRMIHVKVDATVADPLAVVDAASRGEVGRLFSRAAAAIRTERPAGAPDLTRWVELAACEDPDRTVATLRGTAGVVDAFVEPDTVLADMPITADDARGGDDGDTCPIKTPAYNPLQGYLGPAPGGIDAAVAWREPGGRGAGVWFADIEGGWNTAHEDIPGDRMRNVAGRATRDRGWSAHGTAVVGEIAGRDNQLGMLGIAPDVARIFTASIFGSSVAEAIDRAQAAMRPGDVLLIELQRTGPRRRYLPVEYWNDVYEVIKVATARGVIVIEAAGNGAENLDHREYRGRLDRAGRDSGAILVGAGAPPAEGFTDRSRLDFSNYGGRVDVQGWGRRVATLDYGDLQACGDSSSSADRDYTALFAGTSSASPIVAGAALVLQGIALARDGRPVTPAQMRQLLRATGTPQTDGPHGPATEQIGPRPDLARAIPALDDARR